jgi:DNA repair exonuclease SbcCD ATPase subunit
LSVKEFCEAFVKEIDRVEAERQRQRQLRRMEEERSRRLHEQAVAEAKDELNEYARLINEARGLLDEYEVEADRAILRQLYNQLEDDPNYVAEEAQTYRRLLAKDLQKAREKAEEKKRQAEEEEQRKWEKAEEERQRKWLMQKEIEAAVQLSVSQDKLRKILEKLSWDFYKLKMKGITDPEYEKTTVQLFRQAGFQVDSIDDMEKALKKFYADAVKGELRGKLKDNPYRWVATYLNA